MQTVLLLAIVFLVALGIGSLCLDWYRNRDRASDPQAIESLTAIDAANVMPLDPVSMSEAPPAVEGLEHWATAAAEAISDAMTHH